MRRIYGKTLRLTRCGIQSRYRLQKPGGAVGVADYAQLPISRAINQDYRLHVMKAEGQGGYAASANRSSGDQLQGLVAPTRAGLIFRAGDTEVTLPLTGLWLRLGGLQQQFLVFDHREYLQWAIRTRDFSILGESAFSENPDLRIQLKQLKRRSHVIRFKRKLKVYAKVTRRRLASVANSVLWFF